MRGSKTIRYALCIATLTCCALSVLNQSLDAQTTSDPVGAISSITIPPNPNPKERWDKYARDTFTTAPIYFASFGAASGSQISNSPPAWHRTTGGYFRRVGTVYASFAIQNSVYDAGSALLRTQDDYVHCQCRGGWRRAGHALQMTALTYHNGHKVLDLPQFAGAYAGGMIPILWYPRGYSPFGEGLVDGTAQLGLMFGVNQIREFSPELKRFFRKLKP